MASREKGNYQTIRKPGISVCSSAQVMNVQGFIDALHEKCTDVISDVRYFELPYNDIDRFSFRNTGIDVMILCHSIHNRRFAITDVKDALYDRFLPYALRALGITKICVLVHDFRGDKLDPNEKYLAQIKAFRLQQPTTFKCANLVLMGGKLDEKVELNENQWEELQAFLMDAGQSPQSMPTNHICRAILIYVYDIVNAACQCLQNLSSRGQLLFVLFIIAVGLLVVLLVVLTSGRSG